MKFSSALFITVTAFLYANVVNSKEGETWAVLIVGYDYYRFTYGFEASVYKLYTLLRAQGIPAKRIITLSPDIIAFNEKNPNPGTVTYGRDAGLVENYPNYYEDIEIDYKGKIRIDDFYDILRANKTIQLSECGSGKVLNSGPKDNVFLYYIGFGYLGYFTILGWTYTSFRTFVPFLEELKEKKHFNKMFLIFDVNYAGMMFDEYLDTDKGILAYTLGGRFGDQYYCHYNKALRAFTSTCAGFAQLTSMEKSLAIYNGKEKIYDYFQNSAILGSNTAIEHNLYGQLEIGAESIGEFLGYDSNWKQNVAQNYSKKLVDMDMETLGRYVNEQTANRATLEEHLKQDTTIPETKKNLVENLMISIINDSLRGSGFSYTDIKDIDYEWVNNNQNYENILNEIVTNCFQTDNKVLFLLYVKEFLKLSNFKITPDTISEAIMKNC